jgi:hypothetical protein
VNPFQKVSGGWTWLASRSGHWKVVVGAVVGLAFLVGMWRFSASPPAPINYIEAPVVQDATPGGTPIAESTATTRAPCRNPFGTEALPFDLTPDAERMIGADPTGTKTDPCVAQDLAWELLLATPVESANAAGKVCAARLFTEPAAEGPGGVLRITFDVAKGTQLLDCTAKAQSEVQVPEGGRLPTVPVGGQ